jgi:exosortase
MKPSVNNAIAAQSFRSRVVSGAAPALLVLATAVLVAPAFVHAFGVWSTTEEFSFGYLIPVISIGLLIWKRQAIKLTMGRGATTGLVIVLPALAVYLLAQRIEINALAGIAVPPLLVGVVVFLFGWAAGRAVAFPLGFLVFGLGLFRGLLDSVGFALQGITATGAATLANGIGLNVARDGLVLTSDRFAFIVAEPCSGMSSLVSLLALSALWTYVTRGSLSARTAVVLSTVPLVIVANSLRVTLVMLVAAIFGQDVAVGFFHSASSLVLFGIALGGLILVSRMVGCSLFTPARSY